MSRLHRIISRLLRWGMTDDPEAAHQRELDDAEYRRARAAGEGMPAE